MQPKLNYRHARVRKGFSLIEVLLAIGVLAVAIMALLRLLTPTLSSVKEVMDMNKATDSMGAIDAFIQEEQAFATVYDWISEGNAVKTLYVYSVQDDLESPNQRLVVADPEDTMPGRENRVGTSFLLQLYKSRLLDGQMVEFPDEDSTPPPYDYGQGLGAALPADSDDYALAYLLITIELYRVEMPATGPLPDPAIVATENNLILSYTTAKNR